MASLAVAMVVAVLTAAPHPPARRLVVAHGGAHEALTVKADDVTIRGLTIRNVSHSFVEDRAGIRLDGVRGCRVEGNHLVDTFFGIYAARASDCTIADNRIEGQARRQTEAG